MTLEVSPGSFGEGWRLHPATNVDVVENVDGMTYSAVTLPLDAKPVSGFEGVLRDRLHRARFGFTARRALQL